MNAGMRVIALVVLSVAQLVAAVWSIARFESTLSSGTPYKMRVRPVDPADAFRGRYVAVQPSLTIDKSLVPESDRLTTDLYQNPPKAFVILGTDAQGFARADRIVADRPSGVDYLAIDRVWETLNPGRTPPAVFTMSFPFDRYYMNEAAAPAAQQRYWEATRRNASSTAWLTVRVRNGLGVIEGLYIDGVPIEDVVKGSSR